MKPLLGRLIRAVTPYEVRRQRFLPPGGLEALPLALGRVDFGSERPVAVQIGAADGVLHDPLYPAIAAGRFRAVLLEPHPVLFERLRATHDGDPRVRCVNAALAPADGPVTLYCARVRDRQRLSNETGQKSSFSKRHVLRHGIRKADVEAVDVRGMTFTTLLAENDLERIDLLQVDAEGFDARAVLLAFDAGLVPTLINFEHVHLAEPERRELFRALAENGYRWLHDAANTLAVHSRASEGRSIALA